MYTGPNTVNDGLVFGYDTGYGIADNDTATRFYPGEPTTNILSNTVDFSNWTLARNSGSYPTVTANTSANPLGKSYEGMADKVYIPEDGTYPRIQQYFTPSSTNTHTFSVWIRSLSGDCDCFLGAFRNSPWNLPGYSVNSITSEWQRFTFSWTPPDTTTHVIYMGSHDTAAQKGNTLEFWGAQMEENSHNTPYTPGSRSNTQSLIDLKSTTDIDVSTLSFDSIGQPVFDGTNDYLQLNAKFLPTIGAFTMEFLYQISTTGGRGGMFERNPSSPYNGALIGQGGTGDWYFQVSNGSQSLTIDDMGYPSTNTWYHDVGVYDGVNTIKFYRNGSLHDTVTGSTIGNIDSGGSRDNMRFMKRDNNSNTIGGKVAISKVHNKALSDAEVKQNFNAYKNRFNI